MPQLCRTGRAGGNSVRYRRAMPGPADLIDELRRSEEPSLRWHVRRHTLGEDPDAPAMRRLGNEIRRSTRVQALLAARDATGRMSINVYAKWQGPHWILGTLADLGYPAGDAELAPLCGQVLDFWLGPSAFEEFEARSKSAAYRRRGVPVMHGRYRRCGSQQGNALRSAMRLGLGDQRCATLVGLLRHWQWPDGGWNCDRNPEADTSAFAETLLPMRGLAAYAAATGDPVAAESARRAAEVLLQRQLYRRRTDGSVIHPEFTQLHFPLYWHYDFLGGLVGLTEAGLIDDPRCTAALDLLESKRLPDGGWPAEKRFHRTAATLKAGHDWVDWGPTGRTRRNDWVSANALRVLRAAGRLG
jgi:hypothetical protein